MEASSDAVAVAAGLLARGAFAEAEESCRQALTARPGDPRLLDQLGVILIHRERPAEAVEALRRAVQRAPATAAFHCHLGIAYAESRDFAKAAASLRRAMRLGPGNPEYPYRLGEALRGEGRLEDAVESYRVALEIDPTYVAALSNLAIALTSLGRCEEAEAAYRRALEIDPMQANVLNNLGILCVRAERRDEAERLFRRALEIAPGFEGALHNLARFHYQNAMALLRQGRFAEGWEEFRWRWKMKEFERIGANMTGIEWDGAAPEGKALFLYPEQGYGDSIQFVRYAPLLARRGARVFVGCPTPLARLFRTIRDVAGIVADGDNKPYYDAYATLFDMPRLFASTVETIPAEVPYLFADPAASAAWRERLGDGLKVGLVWAGNPRHSDDAQRSLPPAALAPLWTVANARFFSLQVGERAGEVAAFPPGRVNDLTPEIADFADTAAILSALDLLISVDTGPAHLAGAMARPAWTLLPHGPDWRWFSGRDDSPWYPTMRLFRQPEPDDWASVVQRVAARLAAGDLPR